jgi:hypothetical protein
VEKGPKVPATSGNAVNAAHVCQALRIFELRSMNVEIVQPIADNIPRVKYEASNFGVD